jgi:hypothetical protein
MTDQKMIEAHQNVTPHWVPPGRSEDSSVKQKTVGEGLTGYLQPAITCVLMGIKANFDCPFSAQCPQAPVRLAVGVITLVHPLHRAAPTTANECYHTLYHLLW